MARLPNQFPYRRKAWEDLLNPTRIDFSHRSMQKELRRWVPNTHIKIAQALVEFGAARIEGWTGTEHEARRHNAPPDPPWSWYLREGSSQEYFVIGDDGKKVTVTDQEAHAWWRDIEPTLIEEWEGETKARERWLECLEQMRNELATRRIMAEVLQESGTFEPIPSKEWIGENGGKFLGTGVAEFRVVGYSGYTVKGPVVLKRGFLKAGTISARRSVTSSVEASEVVKQKDRETRPPLDVNHFPYLAFMWRATREGPFAPGKRVPKKTIEDWLRRNWPEHLGDATPNKIINMATFLRRPEDEKGGNL